MNALDVGVVLAMVVAASGGWAAGFVARSTYWIGSVLGLIVAAWAVPFAFRFVDAGGAGVRLAIAIVVILTGIAIGASAGAGIGARIRAELPRGSIRRIDRAGGGLAGALGILVILWLLLPTLAAVPGLVARQTRNSAIADAVDSVAPRPPSPLRQLGSLVAEVRFPDVFADLGPAPDAGAVPGVMAVPEPVLRRVADSTSSVEAFGCGGTAQGSAWTVAEDLVVTNAHVIAGAHDVRVRRPGGRVIDARVVAFDPDRDVALLRAPGIRGGALSFGNDRAGADAAVVGYPLGQDEPRPAPAVVRRRTTAVGRDIYGEERVRRSVLIVAADLRSGDSGGPVVDRSGRVVGMVFAIAADRNGTAYALDASEVRAVMDGPRNARTGRCVA